MTEIGQAPTSARQVGELSHSRPQEMGARGAGSHARITDMLTRDINAPKDVIAAASGQFSTDEKIRRLGLSPRQIDLNRHYAYFRAQQHDDCTVDWDGSQVQDNVGRASIVSQAVLQPGYQDLTGQLSNLPPRYRKPSVPCHLCRLVVSRFSGLLYSEQQNPAWKVPGDQETEGWVQAITEAYGLWAMMAQARDHGGAMGTAVPGFAIVDGRVVFEALDPRWCIPTFDPKNPRQLEKIEIRYMYPKDVRDSETGLWREESFWYLRIVTKDSDCLWKPQPVGDGSSEPRWEDPSTVEQLTEHGLGFVPYEWILNLPVSDAIDGDPDCLGSYDYFDRIGELDSQIHGGAFRNADPTPVLASDGNVQEIGTGSKDALKLEKGGTLTFAETSGSSLEVAAKESDRLEDKALQICECVLADQRKTDGAPMTATEITKRTAAMFAKASRMRTQYGARGAVVLMEKLVKAARMLDKGRAASDGEADGNGHPIPAGTTVRSRIIVPPKVGDDGKLQDHKLGSVAGAQLKLVWPPFAQPSPQETNMKVTAAVAARVGGKLITLDTGVRYLAPDFHIEDPRKEIAELRKEPDPGADLAEQSLRELQEGR